MYIWVNQLYCLFHKVLYQVEKSYTKMFFPFVLKVKRLYIANQYSIRQGVYEMSYMSSIIMKKIVT